MSSRVCASISVSQSSGQPMCSVPRPRWLCVATGTASRIWSICASSKPSSCEAQARLAGDELLRARARGDALRGDADEPARALRGRHRRAVERVDLLRLDAGDGGGLVLGVARGDRHLGAQRVLAVADALGDLLREDLGLEAALAEQDLADRVVDDLLEAAHVRALLARAEVDEAVEPGHEQLRRVGLPDADDLLDVRDADARQGDVDRRQRGLDVGLVQGAGLHGISGQGRRATRLRWSCACGDPGVLVLEHTHFGWKPPGIRAAGRQGSATRAADAARRAQDHT